jgi:hypothetical protein
MKPLSISIPLALAIPTLVSGLLVEPASPQCADTCGNILTSTRGSEMTCDDADYASSTYGATFKACISCELNSTYYNPPKKTSDLQWAIYNLRYALSWCLFGADNNTNTANTPCLTRYVIPLNLLPNSEHMLTVFCSQFLVRASSECFRI